jgi:hypothetical protein
MVDTIGTNATDKPDSWLNMVAQMKAAVNGAVTEQNATKIQNVLNISEWVLRTVGTAAASLKGPKAAKVAKVMTGPIIHELEDTLNMIKTLRKP